MAFLDRFKSGQKTDGPRTKPKAKKPEVAKVAKVADKTVEKPVVAKVVPSKDSTAYRVLVHPIVSEKTSRLEKQRTYVFVVFADANKVEIKKAVEKHYRVRVTNVNVVNVKGKWVRYGRTEGKRKDWRKAYVTVGKGQSITF